KHVRNIRAKGIGVRACDQPRSCCNVPLVQEHRMGFSAHNVINPRRAIAGNYRSRGDWYFEDSEQEDRRLVDLNDLGSTTKNQVKTSRNAMPIEGIPNINLYAAGGGHGEMKLLIGINKCNLIIPGE